MKRKRLLKWSVVAFLALTVMLLTAFKMRQSGTPSYFTQPVAFGDVHQDVQSTGTIDAVTTVQVGTQVSGTVAKLGADFNSHVTRGEVIAEIDPTLFQEQVAQALADLQNAQATVVATDAQLAKAKDTAAEAQQQWQRSQQLFQAGVESRQQLDADQTSAQTAQADVAATEGQLSEIRAQVQLKQAALKTAQTNLDHTIIRAPINGTVTARNVDVGQTVAASLQAPTLFNIAQDLTHMRVYANVDESDVGQIHAGQPAMFRVDAFPDQVFHGTISQVRMNPTTVQNVVTYTAVVDFDNPQLKLYPGMTAYVTVPVATATGTLKVPDAALRYKPNLAPRQLSALLAQIGITAPARGSGRSAAPSAATIVWKLGPANALVPVEVRTGITDHTDTAVQVVAGALHPNDQLVTGAANSTASSFSGSTGKSGAGRMPSARML
jgi:HlyD family secretion protein